MAKNWNEPAFPAGDQDEYPATLGVTIREVAAFAAMISIGSINAHPHSPGVTDPIVAAIRAVELADAVLAELGYVDGDGP